MAKFKVGQKVIHTSEAREQVGLSREVEAIVEAVHYVIEGRPPVYVIGWPPTGYATVSESEIREDERSIPPRGVTVEEKLINMLYEHGLLRYQAIEIIERVKADEAMKPMEGRWHEPAEDYPSSLFAALWLSTKDHALQWIDENLPKAWFRPSFT